MEIHLQEITKDNFNDVVALKVADDQTDFVASNVLSIAHSKVLPFLIPKAIHSDNSLVGFTLYGKDPENGQTWLMRLMIDAAHQGKGYGKAAVIHILEVIRREYAPRDVFLSYMPENKMAAALYESLGFSPTGETDDIGEIIMHYQY